MKINVHIDRLILDEVGVGRERGAAVCDAVERELARLISGTPHAKFVPSAIAAIRAPEIRFAEAEPAQVSGIRIAGSVHSAIMGDGR